MAFVKRYVFIASLLLILLSTGILCACAISNYEGGTTPARNFNDPRGYLQSEGNRPYDVTEQTTGERSRVSGSPNRAPEGQAPDAGAVRRERNRQAETENRVAGQAREPGPDQPGAPSGGSRPGATASAGTRYAPQLLACAAVFLILSVAAYRLLARNKLKIEPDREKALMLTLLGAGLLLRVAASTLMEGHTDIYLFKSWASSVASNFSQFYSGFRPSDYPPLYIYVLYLIGKVAAIPAVNPYYTLLLKLPSIAADIASSYLIYRLARKRLAPETGVLLSAFYVFNPAVFINSTFWGQVDSFFTLIVIAAVCLLSEKKTGLSAFLFAAAVLMKPQGIIFLPVLFFELVRQKSFKTMLKAATIALSAAAVIVLPFSYSKGVLWIFSLFSKTAAEYPYASVNAFNFFGLIGKNYVRDGNVPFLFSYHTWGIIFIVLVALFAWFIYVKGKSSLFASAAALLLIAGVFTFSTRMHERYLFPAVALSILAFIYLKDKRLLLLSAGFSAAVYINTHYVLFKTSSGINSAPYSPVLIFTSLLTVVLFVCLVKVLYDIAVKKRTYTCRCLNTGELPWLE